MLHVGVVLIRDLAPVSLGPLGEETTAGSLERLVFGRPLEEPGVLDAAVRIGTVGPYAEQDGDTGIDRPHHVGKEVDVLRARELVVGEAVHVHATPDQELPPATLVATQHA